MIRLLRHISLFLATVLLTGCGGGNEKSLVFEPAGNSGAVPDRVVHVHGLGVNPKDGTLYAATHFGMFRITGEGSAERVGESYQDTMGFTVEGPDQFLGSGHPDFRDYQAGRLHPLLGLIRSDDAGKTWKSVSLK